MDSNYNSQKGFSLIEVLVSLSIFAIVVTLGVGSMLVLIDANAKAQNTQQVINNVSFMLDSFVRDLRTGYGYYCSATLPNSGGAMFAADTVDGQDCTGGADGIVFTESGGSLTAGLPTSRIGYRRSVDGEGRGFIERRLSNQGWSRVTAPDVDITTLEFVVTGTERGTNQISPTVTVFVEGTAGSLSGLNADFAIQTTVTQQTLDL